MKVKILILFLPIVLIASGCNLEEYSQNNQDSTTKFPTAYLVGCYDWLITGGLQSNLQKSIDNCTQPMPQYSVSYKIDPTTKEVIQWFNDQNSDLLKGGDCAVIDQNNWSCNQNNVVKGSYASYGSKNGNYYNNTNWILVVPYNQYKATFTLRDCLQAVKPAQYQAEDYSTLFSTSGLDKNQISEQANCLTNFRQQLK